jgi:DNA-binding transcriptional regulator YhcF (GntR family)
VARTYRELESAGIVVSRRGGGTRVTAVTKQRSDAERLEALRDHAELYLHHARLLGASDAEAVEVLRDMLTKP